MQSISLRNLTLKSVVGSYGLRGCGVGEEVSLLPFPEASGVMALQTIWIPGSSVLRRSHLTEDGRLFSHQGAPF